MVAFGLDQKMSHTDLLALLFEGLMTGVAEKSTPFFSVPRAPKTKGGSKSRVGRKQANIGGNS